MVADQVVRDNTEQFFALARERQQMRERRLRGDPWPWTSDEILSNNRFCNVFREDDKTTAWLRENVREPLMGQDRVLFSIIAFRWYNLIETGELIKDQLLGTWDGDEVLGRLMRAPPPHFTGAYIIKSLNGVPKIDGITWAIGNLAEAWRLGADIAKQTLSLEALHTWLATYPYLGQFMAYQIVCDARYTHLFGPDGPRDVNTWTNAGPGAARGLSWIVNDEPMHFSYSNKGDQERMRETMQRLLAESRDTSKWPSYLPPWELSTVQHWACEYDKWRRGRRGDRLKRRFILPEE